MSTRLFFVPCALAVSLAIGACSKDPQKLKVEYLANGDRLAAKKDYSAAVIEYRKALAQDGHFGEARMKLGTAYQALNDLPNAYREFIRAADLLPENVEAQLHAGSLYLAAGEYPEAKARAVTALAKDPKNVEGDGTPNSVR